MSYVAIISRGETQENIEIIEIFLNIKNARKKNFFLILVKIYFDAIGEMPQHLNTMFIGDFREDGAEESN